MRELRRERWILLQRCVIRLGPDLDFGNRMFMEKFHLTLFRSALHSLVLSADILEHQCPSHLAVSPECDLLDLECTHHFDRKSTTSYESWPKRLLELRESPHLEMSCGFLDQRTLQ
jgi:hypothetical protein